jgi:hypothetical protein
MFERVEGVVRAGAPWVESSLIFIVDRRRLRRSFCGGGRGIGIVAIAGVVGIREGLGHGASGCGVDVGARLG